jgi:hypothetical protein
MLDLLITSWWRAFIIHSSLDTMLFVVAVQLGLIVVCVGSCFVFEFNMRVAFLLHLQFEYERERAERALDSIFPPYGTDLRFLLCISGFHFDCLVIGFFFSSVSSLIHARSGRNDIIAHAEEAVTVIFCDLVDFHKLMMHIGAQRLVEILNRIYSKFDLLCAQFLVQKMETVGKTYMVCAVVLRNFIKRFFFFFSLFFCVIHIAAGLCWTSEHCRAALSRCCSACHRNAARGSQAWSQDSYRYDY